jgi:hypothetical protein
MPRTEHLVEEDEEQAGEQAKKKKKRFLASDKLERALLILSAGLFIAAITFTMPKLKQVKVGDSGKLRGLEIVWVALGSEVEPKGYDPLVELRIAMAERGPLNQLKPFVIVLRGPWGFGVSDIDRVALALGPPVRRGPGYLMYDLYEGKIRLGALFNGGRLDTLYLTPNACPVEEPECKDTYAWGLTRRQIAGEDLVLERPAAKNQPCGRLTAAGRGFYYVACPAGESFDEPGIAAVYIQRITPEVRNPPHILGITGPTQQSAAGWTKSEYDRLLEHYAESTSLKQRVLGPESTALQFWKFETARLLLEAGRAKDGAAAMREAIDALSKRLGTDHEDLAAMRLWLPKTR